MEAATRSGASERRAFWRLVATSIVGILVVVLLLIDPSWAPKLGVCFVAWGCVFLMIFLGARGNPGWNDLSREIEGAGIYLVAMGTLVTLDLPGGAWDVVLVLGVVAIVAVWDNYRVAWMTRFKKRQSAASPRS